MGAIANRIAVENNTAKYIATDNTDVIQKFEALLSFIRKHAGLRENGELLSVLEKENLVEMPDFYDNLFFKSALDIIKCVQGNHDNLAKHFAEVHRHIQPYAIYFPQFYPIPENNVNFYEGYTDMTNLVAAKLEDPSLLTPLKNLLGFYDLVQNVEVIPRQIKIAKSFGMAGFAIYYYWFSDNSISHKHMIFQEVIDRFFDTVLENFSLFFVYCNEAWTKNVAFGTHRGGYTIANNYTEENVKANMQNLVTYFRHPNYRKIRNRPVLFLHHPHEMTGTEIRLLKTVGDSITQENGFDGIELVMDSKEGMYPYFSGYYLHANYKSAKAKEFMNTSTRPKHIDYKAYVREFLPKEKKLGDNASTINSVFTNFDNTVRFYAHEGDRQFEDVGNKAMFMTRTQGRSVTLFKEFLDVQLKKYSQKSDPISQIFLINAWNEWGEQMVMEPSNEEGFAYLEAFQERLLLTPLPDSALSNAWNQ
ncbi:lipopolysaccharide biosynthesis protein [Nannochloropsis oceanica]